MRNIQVILAAVLSGAMLVASVQGDDPKPQRGVDTVTVVFRGQTQHFKAQDAEKLAKVGMGLLESSCEERDISNDAEGQQRYETVLKRSCVILRFAQPQFVPKAGNNQVPVRVETLVIPFSPDLDPETVYVLPGRPARAFGEFTPDPCNDLRSMLVHAGIYPASPGAAVSGVVRVDGTPPTPRTWKVDEAIQRAFGLTKYTEETWLVGADKGLRNCVVTLRPRNPERRMTPRPLAKATIDKDMVMYDPRILVVTPGTPVTLSNTNSPCKGYMIQGTKLPARNEFNYMIPEGEERTVVLKGPDLCSITCPVRPYARGYIHVVDSPYYAITNSAGKFTISNVPPDEYDITVWHEAAGKLKKESGQATITVKESGTYALSYTVAVPGNSGK